jgi:hypothetical protein
VHIPGRVQPHGVLLALSEPDMTILQASANAEALLHRAAVSLAGQPLDVLLDPEPVQRLREALLCKHVTVIPVRLFTVRVRGCPTLFDATAHCAGDVLILEMEPQPPPPSPGTPDLNYLLKTGFPHLAQSDSLLAFCQAAAEMVRRITGFDRVMVYRFDSDWNGEVIAEDKRTDWEPYLGLRYPASDIPRQAREMYLKTALRLIVDVHAEPVPLVPLLSPSTGAALDMTYAILRAVSPVHIEYLKNMGVGASMSIAIVKRGVLWGLIACHHETAGTCPTTYAAPVKSSARSSHSWCRKRRRRGSTSMPWPLWRRRLPSWRRSPRQGTCSAASLMQSLPWPTLSSAAGPPCCWTSAAYSWAAPRMRRRCVGWRRGSRRVCRVRSTPRRHWRGTIPTRRSGPMQPAGCSPYPLPV